MSDSFVCSGAMMRCTMGTSPAKLTVLPIRMVNLTGKPQANISDKMTMVNLAPFGLCRSLAFPPTAAATAAALGTLTPTPCLHNTPMPWMGGKMDYLIKGQPALLKSCKCQCMWGGTISLMTDGQMGEVTHFKYNKTTKDDVPQKFSSTIDSLETSCQEGEGTQQSKENNNGRDLRETFGLVKGDERKAWHIMSPKVKESSKVFQAALEAGYKYDGENNGIVNENPPWNYQKYNAFIINELESWGEKHPGYSPEDARKEVEKLTSCIKDLYNENNTFINELISEESNYSFAVNLAIKNRGKLREAVGLKVGEKAEAHHLIPIEALKRSKVAQAAVDAGFDFNGECNGIIAIDDHGSHSDYNEFIIGALDAWGEKHHDYTTEQAKEMMESLVSYLKHSHHNKMGEHGAPEKLNFNSWIM